MSAGEPTSLSTLREKLSSAQLQLLSFLWNSYTSSRRWPTVRETRHAFEAASETLKGLSGNVVIESTESERGEVYSLSLLGVLLTNDGRNIHTLLSCYLKFQWEIFRKDPTQRFITSAEVERGCSLSSDESKLLARLLAVGSLLASEDSAGKWSAASMKDVEHFTRSTDFSGEVERIAFAHYNPNKPISVIEGWRYTSSAGKGVAQSLEYQTDPIAKIESETSSLKVCNESIDQNPNGNQKAAVDSIFGMLELAALVCWILAEQTQNWIIHSFFLSFTVGFFLAGVTHIAVKIWKHPKVLWIACSAVEAVLASVLFSASYKHENQPDFVRGARYPQVNCELYWGPTNGMKRSLGLAEPNSDLYVVAYGNTNKSPLYDFSIQLLPPNNLKFLSRQTNMLSRHGSEMQVGHVYPTNKFHAAFRIDTRAAVTLHNFNFVLTANTWEHSNNIVDMDSNETIIEDVSSGFSAARPIPLKIEYAPGVTPPP